MAASPDLLKACKAQHEALDRLLARLFTIDHGWLPSESAAWPAVVEGNAAITKAEGHP
jgi:hypothetical protein